MPTKRLARPVTGAAVLLCPTKVPLRTQLAEAQIEIAAIKAVLGWMMEADASITRNLLVALAGVVLDGQRYASRQEYLAAACRWMEQRR